MTVRRAHHVVLRAGRLPALALALLPVLPAPTHALQIPASVAIASQDSASAMALLADAAAFMEAYAADLLRGDRQALAARYARTGVYELRPGQKRLSSHDAVAAHYAAQWKPPATFEWRDLSYEVVGPDAVVVAGLFAWGMTAEARPIVQSYAALLRRQDGELRLRLEAEAGTPPVPWAVLGIAAVLLVALTLTLTWIARRALRRGVHGGSRLASDAVP